MFFDLRKFLENFTFGVPVLRSLRFERSFDMF